MAKECPDCGYSKRVTLSDGTRACGDCGYAFKAGKTAPATSSAQNTEHNTTIEIVDVAPFELDGIGRCSCGWTETVRGHWPSEARRLALIAVLDHKNAATTSAQPEPQPEPNSLDDIMSYAGTYTVRATEYDHSGTFSRKARVFERTYTDLSGSEALSAFGQEEEVRRFNQATTEYSVRVALPSKARKARKDKGRTELGIAADTALSALLTMNECPCYVLGDSWRDRVLAARDVLRELSYDLQNELAHR